MRGFYLFNHTENTIKIIGFLIQKNVFQVNFFIQIKSKSLKKISVQYLKVYFIIIFFFTYIFSTVDGKRSKEQILIKKHLK